MLYRIKSAIRVFIWYGTNMVRIGFISHLAGNLDGVSVAGDGGVGAGPKKHC